ncbi:type IV pilus modification protein PilV [Corallincola platygyrae]|uniref:Type IV pilus modification protein PilV n=1 Tax=Corallincola platygyrae TaxID=1193278 RepID=A0ABW4XNX1_9GAMM
MKYHSRSSTRQAGFSMLELLIAILVLVIGILGVGMLQSVAKRGVFEASQRTMATVLANDIIERMRTNRAQALASRYDGNFGGGTQSAPRDCSGFAASCNSAEVTLHDLYVWEQMLDGADVKEGGSNISGLTDVTGCIQQVNGTVTVVVAWHGLTKLSDAGSNKSDFAKNCGTSGEHRRMLTVETFISL